MTTPGAINDVPEAQRQQRCTQGLLAIWHGVEPGFEPAFDEWYDRQHHAERVAIPGFARARRYLNLGIGPRYFARYDVADATVLASDPYLAALNHPTPWTQKLMPRYRATTRAVFRFASGSGNAEGAELVTLRIAAGAAPAELAVTALAALVGAPGVLRVEVWDADAVASTLRTKEKELRAEPDNVVSQAILIEGSSMVRVVDAVARHLLPRLEASATIDHYRLAFVLRGC